MIHIDEYVSLVKQYFVFLESEFNYEFQGFEKESRVFIVNYFKDEFLVSILYSIVNKNIEVTIYNHTSVVKPGEYSWKYSVELDYIIKKETGDFYNFKSIENLDLKEKIKISSELLKKYGFKILSRSEWYSWGEIAGYNQYVPPELP